MWLRIGMNLADHTGHHVRLDVSKAEAETFLGLEAGSWSLETGLPGDSLAKLERVEGEIVELGVEVNEQFRVFPVLNTSVTC